jgi:hypothetical protein
MSGSPTISTSGTPARFQSTSVSFGGTRASGVSWRSLPAVLFEMDADETDRARAGRRVDLDRAAGREGAVVLGDLVALRKIRVEVVLARETGVGVNGRSDGLREPQPERDGVAVQNGKRSRKAETDRARGLVRGGSDRDRTRAEDLRSRLELSVDLEPDDGENPRLFRRFDRRHREILTRRERCRPRTMSP